MKKLILLLAFSTLAGLAGCPPNNTIYLPNKPPFKPLEALWEATAWVESTNNPNALNEKEMAIGIVQIRKIRLTDYNERTGKNYKPNDCYDPQISKEIWFYFATKFHPYDYEGISKAWNGRGKSNIIYWGKVKKQLKYLEISKQ
jgi:hypothetical protein